MKTNSILLLSFMIIRQNTKSIAIVTAKMIAPNSFPLLKKPTVQRASVTNMHTEKNNSYKT